MTDDAFFGLSVAGALRGACLTGPLPMGVNHAAQPVATGRSVSPVVDVAALAAYRVIGAL